MRDVPTPVIPNDPLPAHRLSLDSIAAASAEIDPVFLSSPQYVADRLGDALDCELLVKVETNNPIRCFKGRGADFFLSRITGRGDHRQLVCASTGNFGQAMAHACRRYDRPLIVYADAGANPLKTGRIADWAPSFASKARTSTRPRRRHGSSAPRPGPGWSKTEGSPRSAKGPGPSPSSCSRDAHWRLC